MTRAAGRQSVPGYRSQSDRKSAKGKGAWRARIHKPRGKGQPTYRDAALAKARRSVRYQGAES